MHYYQQLNFSGDSSDKKTFLAQRRPKYVIDVHSIHMETGRVGPTAESIQLNSSSSKNIHLILINFFILLIKISAASASDGQKLLVISLDGFRYDYYDRYVSNMPSLATLAKNGVRAVNGMKSTFTTMTFPAHWTIATGLNEESHGIVANSFWDPSTGETFKKSSNEKFFYRGEPIWVTAKKAGKKTAVVMWVGIGVNYSPFNADFVLTYNHTFPLEERVNLALGLLKNGTDFAMMYWHEPDSVAHINGAFSLPLKDKLNFISEKLDPIVSNATIGPLAKKLNIIILSDHGMANITNKQTLVMSQIKEKAINLAKITGDILTEQQVIKIMDQFKISPNGVITHFYSGDNQFNSLAQADLLRKLISSSDEKVIQEAFQRVKSEPKFSKETNDQIYGDPIKFQNITYYLKPQLPKRWFYSNNDRIGHLVAVGDEGSLLTIAQEPGKWTYSTQNVAAHGFDNEINSMKTLFIAYGPRFKSNYKLQQSFPQNCIYSLMCHVLNITPAPNNGSLEPLKDALNSSPKIVLHPLLLIILPLLKKVTWM